MPTDSNAPPIRTSWPLLRLLRFLLVGSMIRLAFMLPIMHLDNSSIMLMCRSRCLRKSRVLLIG